MSSLSQLSRTSGVTIGKGFGPVYVMDLFLTVLERAATVLLVALSLGGFVASTAWALALVFGTKN